MAHSIQAFIAPRIAFDRLGLGCPAALVELPQGLALLAITEELRSGIHDSVGGGKPRHRYVDLRSWDDADFAFLKRLAKDHAAAYVETDYFGGMGEQSAVVARDGGIVFGPRHAEHGPINAALRILGVRKERDLDEYDTLGLGLYRDNGKLVRAYYLRDWQRAAIGVLVNL